MPQETINQVKIAQTNSGEFILSVFGFPISQSSVVFAAGDISGEKDLWLVCLANEFVKTIECICLNFYYEV